MMRPSLPNDVVHRQSFDGQLASERQTLIPIVYIMLARVMVSFELFYQCLL